jgi:hypothetical protein
MPNQKDIPYLLLLLEDPDLEIRSSVATALLAFGPDLPFETASLRRGLSPDATQRLDELIVQALQLPCTPRWLQWLDASDSGEALEEALLRLAYFDYGIEALLMPSILEAQVRTFRRHYPRGSADMLIQFVFQEGRFEPPYSGAPHAMHDNLMFLLRTGEGSPLLLSALTVLLARRLGLPMAGIFIQGNFLLQLHQAGTIHYLNPANQGQPFTHTGKQYITTVLQEHPPREVVAQLVRHILERRIVLCEAYGQPEERRHYQQRLWSLEAELGKRSG